MKTVKFPDLSMVEQNVPYVHFHKSKDESNKAFFVELVINTSLGTECSEPVITNDPESKTIYVTFNLTHPKHEQGDSFELIHIEQFKVENIFQSEDTLICVNVHINHHHYGPEADSSVIVRYRDIPGSK